MSALPKRINKYNTGISKMLPLSKPLSQRPSNDAPANAAPKTAEDFAVTPSKVTPLTAPRATVRRLSDPAKAGVRIFLYGPSGSGKSYFAKELLARGFRIVFLSTDIGGSGMAAVEGPLRREGKLSALDNGVDIEIRDYATTMKFLEKPESIWPEIYDFDPDIIFWDGFGAFQQIELMEYVGDMSGGKKSTEQRESGLQLEQRDWGLVKQATIRMLDRFCSLHNPKTGKVWHKILTAHEAIKSVSNGDASVLTETKEPLLSGAGGVLSKGAFDLILKTSVRKAKSGEEGDSGGRVFEYVTAGHQNLAAKNRGFDLPPVVPGDGGALFTTLLEQRGLTKDQLDASLKRG